ncbi:hypothetical protein HPP92_022341 [Vanilla planifolia]|uniref:Transcription factor MYBS1 n=1 Tax=Vanilla planifolia TaxID=51239 RepID=A0A835PY21_VANPL|nr:hypothetical protein HPP92_022341 [Vanilla planifolia]
MVADAWSREEEKAFENALAVHFDTCGDWLEKVAAAVPGKAMREIKNHYKILVEDVSSIELGKVPLPDYAPSSFDGLVDESFADKKGGVFMIPAMEGGSKSDHERRKGTAWTEEEHRLFLLGLDKYGKGDWRSISRNFVVSRTPTQVASHAQKYFIRLNSMNKDRRRSSIHDITRVESGEASTNRGPITGQGNCTEVGSTKVEKNPSQPSSAPEIGMESSTMTLLGGQPSAYRARLPASVGASVEEKAMAYPR